MNHPLTQFRSAGIAAPSADNSQPWCFSGDDAEISIRYPTRRLATSNTFGPFEPPTLLAIGAVIENMTQAATAYGGSAVWRAADEASIGNHYGSLTFTGLSPGEVDPARIAAILNRHTNRNPYRSELVDQMILGGLQKNYGTIRLTIVTDETIKTRVADLLRRSGELRFQTPELVAMLSDSLRHNEAEVARGDGLDVRTLALPPGGGQFLKTAAKPGVLRALNGLRLHKLLARIDAQPVARAPALLYLSGPSDRASLVDAGRLLERTWIHLNAAGIAVHPYYALSDQLHRFAANRIALPLLPQAGALAAQAHEVLDFGPGELPQMILRIGYPVRPAPRSRRLPSAAVGLD